MNIVIMTRHKISVFLKRNAFYVYKILKIINTRIFNRTDIIIKNVIFYPTVKDKATLSNLVNRVAWYLPESSCSKVAVHIPISEELVNIKYENLAPPPFQANYIYKSKNVHFVQNNKLNMKGYDSVLFWDVKGLFACRSWVHLGKTDIVDPLFYSVVECSAYRSLFFHAIDNREKKLLNEFSRNNYWRFLNKIKKYKKGYVFGTGPSLDRAFEFDFSNGVRIVCNSIVKNGNILNHIKPHLLVFADPAFHFSPCIYSAEFRLKMQEVVKKFGCFIMIPEQCMPLLLAHYPELKNNLIGMPVKKNKFNFPTLDRFFVGSSDNILSMFMIPVASSVSKEIYIIGVDGRKPGENYFWEHSTSAQFKDLMHTAIETHPSFFRDRVYSDYYKKHCKILKRLIIYGESNGKNYYSLTPSYVPVLAERYNC